MNFRVMTMALCLTVVITTSLHAQQRGQRGGQRGAQTPRSTAPVDLTGYWVSVVTEDWEFRMLTPPKGEFGGLGSIQINDEASVSQTCGIRQKMKRRESSANPTEP